MAVIFFLDQSLLCVNREQGADYCECGSQAFYSDFRLLLGKLYTALEWAASNAH